MTVPLLAGCSAERPAPGAPPSVLLITIDTLRADRVGRGLTPTLDALARDGVTFTNARATAPLTLPSHATILTGALPPEHGVRENGAGPLDAGRPTLASVLRARGYQTAAFVGAYVLDRRFGLANGFDHYDDRIARDPNAPSRLEAERRGEAVANTAIEWLRRADAARPFFAWIHVYDPHAPYAPPAEFLARASGNAYDGEVAYADAQVGRVLGAARAKAGGNLLIAVAGDHGEGLGEHGEATHGMLAYDSTLRVPLILAGAGVAKSREIDTAVSLRDVAPTLLRLAGVTPPDGMSGSDVLSGHAGANAAPEVYAETVYPRAAGWSPLRVLADGRWKLIASADRELYDISRDPGERRNLAAANAPTVAALAARAEKMFGTGGTATAAVTPEVSERLRALGYVSAPPAPTAGDEGANPRDHVDAWNRFEESLSLMTARRFRDAVPALRALSSSYPDARVFHSTYAQALKETGQPREALRLLRALVKRWPDDASLFHDLASAAREAGDTREAMRAEQAALAVNDEDANAQNGLGLLHADAGRAADAAVSFQRATELDPTNASYWTNLGNARRALGDLPAAGHAYRRALDLDSGFADASNGMGVILVQQQRPAEAIAWFERAITADPSLHEAQLNLGIAYQESGDRRRAASQYRKVLAEAPSRSKEKRAASELLAALR